MNNKNKKEGENNIKVNIFFSNINIIKLINKCRKLMTS